MTGPVAAGFLLGDGFGPALLLPAGAVMLLGRFWWAADPVRRFTWRVLEPRGLLPRREPAEEHSTRRLARPRGGALWIASAALLWLCLPFVGWPVALLIVLMVATDAALDFCVLCFASLHLDRAGLLPAGFKES